MYTRTAQTGKHAQSAQRSAGDSALLRLLICLALFLAVFVGKGIFPVKMLALRDQLLHVVTQDTDFRQVFSQLGNALGQENTGVDGLSDFCVEVFGHRGLESEEPSLPAAEADLTGLDLKGEEVQFLSASPNRDELRQHFLPDVDDLLPAALFVEAQQPAEESQPEPEVQAAGTVLLQADYSGPELPGNYTMDQLSLGGLETVLPIYGRLTSEYGYREHPINGNYQFHGGVDIGGQSGDPIAAFAAGTVEYIGEDDSYGLYLQIDHGNGVKSFYAHCKTLCVSKGQTVAAGEKVAEVGATGSATGPHLHFEMKYEKTHLNPAYYLTFAPQE